MQYLLVPLNWGCSGCHSNYIYNQYFIAVQLYKCLFFLCEASLLYYKHCTEILYIYIYMKILFYNMYSNIEYLIWYKSIFVELVINFIFQLKCVLLFCSVLLNKLFLAWNLGIELSFHMVRTLKYLFKNMFIIKKG